MKPTIAVIEDSPDNRMLVNAFLSDEYDLVEYEDGETGLEGLRRSLPNLVLLDISLPGMDGIEVVGRIRQDERLRQLPVIALTAHAMSGDRDRMLAAGFDDYVSKPIVEVETLISAVERNLCRTAGTNAYTAALGGTREN
jgi:two-component system, cell cycle response regulator DivK